MREGGPEEPKIRDGMDVDSGDSGGEDHEAEGVKPGAQKSAYSL